MNLSIRAATLADAAAITRVHIASWQEAYRDIIPDHYLKSLSFENRKQKWHDYLKDIPDSSWLLIVEENSNILGFCNVQEHKEHPEFVSDVYEISAIYCHPDAWGHGAGALLMKETLSRLGDCLCFLWALKENQRARTFYKHFDFYQDGEEKMYDIDGIAYPIVRYIRDTHAS